MWTVVILTGFAWGLAELAVVACVAYSVGRAHGLEEGRVRREKL